MIVSVVDSWDSEAAVQINSDGMRRGESGYFFLCSDGEDSLPFDSDRPGIGVLGVGCENLAIDQHVVGRAL